MKSSLATSTSCSTFGTKPRYPRRYRISSIDLRNRNFAAVRVFWPSKKFTDADLIPGGGAASAAAEARTRRP